MRHGCSTSAGWSVRNSTLTLGPAPKTSSWPAMPVTAGTSVDWTKDEVQDWTLPPRQDAGECPALPGNWPHADAELLSASVELATLDLGIDGLHTKYGDDADSRADYREIEARRNEVIEILIERPARTLEGIEAKAESVVQLGDDWKWAVDLGRSLAD